MKANPEVRDAYVRAEISTSLAIQIRAIRTQRNWSQQDLAKRLGTTQTAVSRLEDPSYGRLSIQTLFDLSKVFDVGLRVQFVSLATMLSETFKPNPKLREVPSFEEEAPFVGFYTTTHNSFYNVSVQSSSKVLANDSISSAVTINRSIIPPLFKTALVEELDYENE